jgi:site-specific DNA-methyltransferase (adenine-specific)
MPPKTITSNTLFYGDNLDVLRKKVNDESIDLCYIDPPFNSKRNYFQIYNNIGQEDKAQAQAFVDTWTWDSYAANGFKEITDNKEGRFTENTIELIKGLRNVLKEGSLFAYLVNMTLRINEIYRVLKSTGTFYLHCDPTASHYLKLVLDSVFLPRGGEFRNEIVWCYRGAGYPKKDFGKRHDIIFRYSKTDEFTFNLDEVREEYAEATKERFKHYIGNVRGKRDFGTQKLNALGRQPDDWWQIQPIAPSGKERLGYPTQKPEPLLNKIIRSSSNEGDIVLDAYCGCGTTIAVAHAFNRRWMGIDITYQSIAVVLKRLEDTFGTEVISGITLDGIPKDMEGVSALVNKKDDRLRKEFEKWALLTYSNNRAIVNERKGADKGIDGLAYFVTAHNQTGKMVFQVKSGNVERGDIAKLSGDMAREQAELAVLITLKDPTSRMREEAAAAGTYYHEVMGRSYNKIQIVTVKEIVEDKRRLEMPLSIEVLKGAERKGEDAQQPELGL